MSEWLSYRPSDFLLFSARTWHRLFELYNAQVWPAQFFAMAIGLALVLAVLKGRPGSGARTCCAMLAACWLWVAWAFHLQRFAPINWAATGYAAAFVLQGLLLLGCGWCAAWQAATGGRAVAGWSVLLFALLIEPWVGLLFGRSWRQADVFGLTPDPTTLATLGVLLLFQPRGAARLLWVIPLLWCAVSGATLWTMHG